MLGLCHQTHTDGAIASNERMVRAKGPRCQRQVAVFELGDMDSTGAPVLVMVGMTPSALLAPSLLRLNLTPCLQSLKPRPLHMAPMLSTLLASPCCQPAQAYLPSTWQAGITPWTRGPKPQQPQRPHLVPITLDQQQQPAPGLDVC